MFLAAVKRGAAEADFEERAGAGSVHLADLHAEIGIVLLVLLDAGDLEAIVGRGLLGDVLLQHGIGRRIVQHADLLDLGFFLEILEARRDLETGRRQSAERPFHVVGLLREDRAQHHRNLRTNRQRRAGEIAGRDAARQEDVGLVGRDHLAIDRHRLLRLGLVVLGDDLDLAAHDAALGVERCGSDLDPVAPASIHCRGVAGQAGRNSDFVDFLRAGRCNRKRGRESGKRSELSLRHDSPPLSLCWLEFSDARSRHLPASQTIRRHPAAG